MGLLWVFEWSCHSSVLLNKIGGFVFFRIDVTCCCFFYWMRARCVARIWGDLGFLVGWPERLILFTPRDTGTNHATFTRHMALFLMILKSCTISKIVSPVPSITSGHHWARCPLTLYVSEAHKRRLLESCLLINSSRNNEVLFTWAWGVKRVSYQSVTKCWERWSENSQSSHSVPLPPGRSAQDGCRSRCNENADWGLNKHTRTHARRRAHQQDTALLFSFAEGCHRK